MAKCYALPVQICACWRKRGNTNQAAGTGAPGVGQRVLPFIAKRIIGTMPSPALTMPDPLMSPVTPTRGKHQTPIPPTKYPFCCPIHQLDACLQAGCLSEEQMVQIQQTQSCPGGGESSDATISRDWTGLTSAATAHPALGAANQSSGAGAPSTPCGNCGTDLILSCNFCHECGFRIPAPVHTDLDDPAVEASVQANDQAISSLNESEKHHDAQTVPVDIPWWLRHGSRCLSKKDLSSSKQDTEQEREGAAIPELSPVPIPDADTHASTTDANPCRARRGPGCRFRKALSSLASTILHGLFVFVSRTRPWMLAFFFCWILLAIGLSTQLQPSTGVPKLLADDHNIQVLLWKKTSNACFVLDCSSFNLCPDHRSFSTCRSSLDLNVCHSFPDIPSPMSFAECASFDLFCTPPLRHEWMHSAASFHAFPISSSPYIIADLDTFFTRATTSVCPCNIECSITTNSPCFPHSFTSCAA